MVEEFVVVALGGVAGPSSAAINSLTGRGGSDTPLAGITEFPVATGTSGAEGWKYIPGLYEEEIGWLALIGGGGIGITRERIMPASAEVGMAAAGAGIFPATTGVNSMPSQGLVTPCCAQRAASPLSVPASVR